MSDEKPVGVYFCSVCSQAIVSGEQLEIETACRSKLCDHGDPEKCFRSTVYSHRDEGCFEAASVVAGHAVVREHRR